MMIRLNPSPLLFVFLFGLSCSDSAEPSPSGDCRVAKIIYQGANERFEQDFEYNADGLLVGYTLPFIGSTCKEELQYDNQKRLVRRALMCGNYLEFEIQYSYVSAQSLEAKYVNHLKSEEGSLALYYNSNNQIDSSIFAYEDKLTFSEFDYNDGNLTSSTETEQPCCRTFTLSEALYDDGINPYTLLKNAANNFGMESISDFIPSGTIISSENNVLKFKRVWQTRVAANDPRIVDEEIRQYEYFNEYYDNSPYLKKIRYSLNGVMNSGETLFIYDACK